MAATATQAETGGSAPLTPPKPEPLSVSDIKNAVSKLSTTPMFRLCEQSDLRELAVHMQKLTYSRNDFMLDQNQPVDHLMVLGSGSTVRLRKGRDGVVRQLQQHSDDAGLGALNATAGDPIYASAKCVSDACDVYAISREQFRKHLATTPRFATKVVESLSQHVRTQSKAFRTPLFAQRSNDINLSAVVVAASVESYYRSALNSVLNRQLSGVKAPLFPNMQVQVPARVAYIAGFKGLRSFLERRVDPDEWTDDASRNGVRLLTAIAPGLIMTPVASVLEACNVGHVNTEPLHLRCTRGVLPRGAREVIFGIGLNQMSDYFEERFRATINPNPVFANTAGSLTAGVAAGYLSHVPHNVSTLKMLQPNKSYGQVFSDFVSKSVPEHLVPTNLPKRVLPTFRAALACLFPRGVMTRTVQICGSFAILNGLIQLIEGDNRRRMRKVMEAQADEEAVVS